MKYLNYYNRPHLSETIFSFISILCLPVVVHRFFLIVSSVEFATGLSSVLSDTSASRRFFMLDGVETKSPSGNIVVVKSGTKVRKMVVR